MGIGSSLQLTSMRFGTLHGTAWWPRGPVRTMRTQQLCMINLVPALTCCGTFYKLLTSGHENKHQHQCPGIDLPFLPNTLTQGGIWNDQAGGSCSLLAIMSQIDASDHK